LKLSKEKKMDSRLIQLKLTGIPLDRFDRISKQDGRKYTELARIALHEYMDKKELEMGLVNNG
jgi:hypothetical protein